MPIIRSFMSSTNYVQVDMNINVDAQSRAAIIDESSLSLNNLIIFPDFTLPVNRLYSDIGSSLFRFQGQSNQIVGQIDSAFATNENKALLKADLQSLVSSYCIAKDVDYDINDLSVLGTDMIAVPFNNYSNNVELMTFAQNTGLGGLVLAVYAHYLFSSIQATSGIFNSGELIADILSDETGSPRLADSLANSLYLMDSLATTDIVNQVLLQDPSRAAADPEVWTPLKWVEGDVIFMQLTIQPPTLVSSDDPSLVIQPSPSIPTMTEPITYNMKILIGPDDRLAPSILYYDAIKSYPSNLQVVNRVYSSITNLNLRPLNVGNAATYSISPALPAGLSLDPNTGAITGSTSINQEFTKYTVTATNSRGSAETSVILKLQKVPNAIWAETYAGLTSASMERDSSDNLYVLGHTIAEVTITNPSTVIPINSVVLMKYNVLGSIQWIKFVTVALATPTSIKLLVDSNGNPIITGHYRSDVEITLNADPIITLPITPGSGGQNAGFMIKYNSSGICQWAYTLQAPNGVSLAGAGIDKYDNLYLAGRAWSSPTWNIGNNVSIPGFNGNQTFIIKYNNTAIPFAARSLGGAISLIYTFIVDADNNVYYCGQTRSGGVINLNDAGTVTLTASLPNSTWYDGFIVKCDPFLSGIWSRQIKGTTQHDSINNIIFDKDNNIIATGFYATSVALDLNGNGSVMLPISSGSSSQDFCTIKYTTDGVALWAKSIASSASLDSSTYIAVDSFNNIYVTGSFAHNTSISSLTLAGEPYPTTTSPTYEAIYVKYDTNGNEIAYRMIQGTGTDISKVVVIDSNNNIYLFGNYVTTATINVNADGTLFLPTSTNRSFLIKFGETSGPEIPFPTFTTTLSDILSEYNSSEVPVAETLQLVTKTIAPNIKAYWLSSDPTKATVSSSGLVTGIATGTVVISAFSGTYSASITITVVGARSISGVSSRSLPNNTLYSLINPPAYVYWFSLNPDIAYIDSSNTASAAWIRTKAVGNATICAYANNRIYSKVLTVTAS